MAGIRRVLVTGAHGFIGSHLTRALLEEGYGVGVLHRESSDLRRIRDLEGRLSHHIADLRDPASVQAAVAEAHPDALVHLATYYAVEHRPDEVGVMMDTNVKGTVALLEASREAGVSLFLNAGTCAVYREKDTPLMETDPVSPQNLYALTKLQAEEACRFYSDRLGVPAATLRLFPPYGPADNERRLIPYVIRSIIAGEEVRLTSGTQRWDFVYVEDVVAAFVAAMKRPEAAASAGTMNVGTGDPWAVRDLVTRLAGLTGEKARLLWGAIPHRKNEVWYNSGSWGLIRSVLGWEPRVSLDDGLERTIAWFRDHPLPAGGSRG
ncbi:MAG: SDR family NAD(P)-dependent oxidoreductase [Methanomicrobiales archaeon]|nr:SDR family NAD(P)-dependent oxidoreductase [Methanomicrobiales archaeon]